MAWLLLVSFPLVLFPLSVSTLIISGSTLTTTASLESTFDHLVIICNLASMVWPVAAVRLRVSFRVDLHACNLHPITISWQPN